ncbi:apolipoprotein N-acyltransferase [Thiocapsa imhoffii]|nr:apolipoprotein N-acyltransferase [Thiocapsa imhoffii]
MAAIHARLYSLLMALLALVSGALVVLGFAPFGWYPMALVGLLGLLFALRGADARDGALRGWLFGVGLMGFGVFWIRISLNEFGNMTPVVANLLTVLFVAIMALYYGLLGWLLRRLGRNDDWVVPGLLFPGIYLLIEWLRGWLFTGFPWLNLGYTQLDGPLSGYAPVVGVYGVGLLLVCSVGLLWGLVHWARAGRWAAVGALVVIWGGGLLLQTVAWTQPTGERLRAAVVQANIPQSIKWDPERLVSTVSIYWELTEDLLGVDLVVWPETAIPAFLHEVRTAVIEPMALRAAEAGSELVLGIPVMETEQGRYYNALLSIGTQEDLYAKRHLVPFGEFMPFKPILGPLVELFEVPMSDFSPGRSERPLLAVGTWSAGVSICYEDAFPSAVSQALPEARFLINVSNDAWFGDSLAPHQHLEIARMRALENGRYLLRATNTGISAIIDTRGRLLGVVPSFELGSLTSEIELYQGATPFARFGNGPVIVTAAFMVLLALGFGVIGMAGAKIRRRRA